MAVVVVVLVFEVVVVEVLEVVRRAIWSHVHSKSSVLFFLRMPCLSFSLLLSGSACYCSPTFSPSLTHSTAGGTPEHFGYRTTNAPPVCRHAVFACRCCAAAVSLLYRCCTFSVPLLYRRRSQARAARRL